MATVDGITAAKAQEIEDASVVSGAINSGNGHLILTTAGGTDIDAGLVKDDSLLIAHESDTSTHGVGQIAGVNEVQSLSNKTLVTPTIASFVNANHTHTDSASGGRAWSFSGCRLNIGVSQSLSDATTTLVNFNSNVDYDTDSYKTSGTVLTIPATGYYDVFVQVTWAGNANGRRSTEIRLNDSTSNGTSGTSVGKTNPAPGHGVQYSQQTSLRRRFTANDYLKVFCFQNSGGALDILGANTEYTTYIAITRLG